MPRFDGTGPYGNGPLTGRGNGYCVLKTSDNDVTEGIVGVQSKEYKDKNKKEDTMPAGDGTGPGGMGPMTGRGAGFCAGYSRPGYTNPVGRGFGMGRGGRGWRNRYYATGAPGWQRAGWGYASAPAATPYPPAPEQELQVLQEQARYMQESLDQINKRIEELDKKE